MPLPTLVDNVWVHAVGAKLDYGVDLNDVDDPWLAAGETIQGTPTVTTPSTGVTISAITAPGSTKIVAWIECTTLGRKLIDFAWVTNQGREDSRRLALDVVGGR